MATLETRASSSVPNHTAFNVSYLPQPGVNELARKLYSRTFLSKEELNYLSRNIANQEGVVGLAMALENTEYSHLVAPPKKRKSEQKNPKVVRPVSHKVKSSQSEKTGEKQKSKPARSESARPKQKISESNDIKEYSLIDEEICVLRKYNAELIKRLQCSRDVMLNKARELVRVIDENTILRTEVESLRKEQTLLQQKYSELYDAKKVLTTDTQQTVRALDEMVGSRVHEELQNVCNGVLLREDLEKYENVLEQLKWEEEQFTAATDRAKISLTKSGTAKICEPILEDLQDLITKYHARVLQISDEKTKVTENITNSRSQMNTVGTSSSKNVYLMPRIQNLLETTKNNLDKLLKKLYRTVETHEQTISDCKATIKDHESTIKDLQAQNSDLTTKLHHTEKVLSETEAGWHDDQHRLEECRETIKNQENQISDLKAEKDDLIAELNSTNKTLKARESTIATMFQQITDLNEEVRLLKVLAHDRLCHIRALETERGDLRKELLDRHYNLIPLPKYDENGELIQS